MINTLPDGPKSFKVWQLLRWVSNPLKFLEECSERYGEIFTLRLKGFLPFVIITKPQVVQQIFSLDAKQFDAGRSNGILRPLVGDNSLLLLDSDRHKREKKLLMPPFHGEKLQVYSQIICDITKTVANKWPKEQPFTARSSMQDITLEVILQAVFGLREGERYQTIKPLLAATLDMTGSPVRSSLLFFKFLQQDWGNWSPWGRMKRRIEAIYILLQEEIDERRKTEQVLGNDILSLMMLAKDENGEPMTDKELKDELMTLLVAGHETTATALAWALYWIHRLPNVKEKLLAELEQLGSHFEPMQLYQLSYLTAVCQETLRIYPVTPIVVPRIPKIPIKFMGYEFDENVMLVPCIYLIHHRQDLYPNPEEFRPERFLERQYSGSEFLPFGGGNRRCLGHALATLELKLVLGTIMSGYELELVKNQRIKPQRRGVTIAPSGGIKMRLTGKRKQQKESLKPELVGNKG